MGIALEAEFPRPEPAPDENRRRRPDNAQRNEPLPIHSSNIRTIPTYATTGLRLFTSARSPSLVAGNGEIGLEGPSPPCQTASRVLNSPHGCRGLPPFAPGDV